METGYVSDVEFTSNYVEDQAPAWMNYTAAINGYAPVPTSAGFDYCELGCGRGLTSLMLAALHPEGRFWAIDLSADHIRSAQAMADAAALRNITFIAAGVGDPATRSVPRCEFISAHGLMSWVSEDVRLSVLAYLKDFLKPGGLAMLSYDALPGFAPIAPLREMLRTFAHSATGNSAEKATAAMEYVKRLKNAKTTYFAQYPYLEGIVDEFAKKDSRYIVHELMTPFWRPFYFREIAERLQGIGLTYAGNLKPRLNYLEYMIPAELREFMAALPSRLLFESHHDLIANSIFRRDLYAAQPPSEGRADLSRADTAHLRFAVARPPEDQPLRGQHQGLDYDVKPMWDRIAGILGSLASGPKNLAAIRSTLREPAPSIADLADLMQALVVTGLTFPCADTAGERDGWPQLNRALVVLAAQEGRAEIPLACPKLGVGLTERSVTAVAMQSAVDSTSAESAADWAVQNMGALRHQPALFGVDTTEELTPTHLKNFFGSAWQQYTDAGAPQGKRMNVLGFNTALK